MISIKVLNEICLLSITDIKLEKTHDFRVVKVIVFVWEFLTHTEIFTYIENKLNQLAFE